MLKHLLDIFFPPVCLLCEKELGNGPLCKGCSLRLRGLELASPLCTLCGAPFPGGAGEDHACGKCAKAAPPFLMARSVYAYGASVLDAVHRFKYGGSDALSLPLGRLMSDAVLKFFPEIPDVIVPVPLHAKRLCERGYNQSLLLAREISRRVGAGLDYTSLKRVRQTRPQIELKSGERETNVRGAFALEAPSALMGRKALLIDDVFTTGSTVTECAKTLKKAGAEVYVLTLARAS